MLLESLGRDRFPSISVSVTLLSILIKYVSRPRAFKAVEMETSNRKSGRVFFLFEDFGSKQSVDEDKEMIIILVEVLQILEQKNSL